LSRGLEKKIENFLFETIKVANWSYQNIDYHINRAKYSSKSIFKREIEFVLPLAKIENGRCKVIYSNKIEKIEFFEYRPKIINGFSIVDTDIEYQYKFFDRNTIDNITTQYPSDVEVIFAKNGILRDSSIANIAFLYKTEWITPKKFMLYGTTLDRLKSELRFEDIYIDDIHKFKKVALMNAMFGFRVFDNISNLFNHLI
jgi:4-amino-4-deoxychorismate lyase